MKTSKKEIRQYYPSLRGVFGDWIYYSCLMPANDVATRINYADEIHPSKALSTLIQRVLNKGRAHEIGDYLLREDQRFFNSMVAAVYNGEPVWHGFANFKPQVDDIDLAAVSEDAEDSVGFLSFTGTEKIFALDGQHRLAGIRNALKRNPKLELGDVSLLLVAHSNSKTGLKRTRQLFTTLNKTARPVGKGEIIALDENDTMALVARHLFDFVPAFSDKRIKFAQADNVSPNDTELTTIGNLYDILYALFTKFPTPKTKQALRFFRPSDEDLAVYVKTAQEFFERLSKAFPELGDFYKATPEKAGEVVKANRTSQGGHILFRPIGLRVFAEVTSVLLANGTSLEDAVSALSALPVNLNVSPYNATIWRNKKIVANGRVLLRDILLYMLRAGGDSNALRNRMSRAAGIPAADVRLPNRVSSSK